MQVAQLAGIPQDVIKAAKLKLTELETTRQKTAGLIDAAQADLFNSVVEPSEVEQKLAEIDPNDLTPKQALDAVFQLQMLLKK